jgi:HlyD family secretion protein
MRAKALLAISALGVLLALAGAFLFGRQPSPRPPVFKPAADPYADGIYATGILESDQVQGEDTDLYPEVSGRVTQVLVAEGQRVRRGDPLFAIDDSAQRATVGAQRAQMKAAHVMLEELRAQPRPQVLAVARAQLENAEEVLRNARDQREKEERSYALEPLSVSRSSLDNVRNAARIAAVSFEVARRQYLLTRAGAWSYDVRYQKDQYTALSATYRASAALLAKYTVRAPADSVVLAIHVSVGSFASPQGTYDTYTEGLTPAIVMGTPENHLDVRAYVDEILVSRLPDPKRMVAQAFIRGTGLRLRLSFVRIQPFISPKIELSDQRQERVDSRVLSIIFRFRNSKNLHLYPGELVDVYIGAD